MGLLEDLPRRKDSLWICPGNDRADASAAAVSTMPGGPCGLRPGWRMEDVRLHDFRHSFGKGFAQREGTGCVISKLLGHGDIETTARYAHLARASIHDAAERISGSIAADVL